MNISLRWMPTSAHAPADLVKLREACATEGPTWL